MSQYVSQPTLTQDSNFSPRAKDQRADYWARDTDFAMYYLYVYMCRKL